MKVKEWPAALCFLGSGVVAALISPRLPNSVPVHWGIDGAPDRFGSRFEALFLPTLLCLGTAIRPLLGLRVYAQPKKNFIAPRPW